MTASAPPHAVVFDFYGTLTDPARENGRRTVIETTAAALGVDAASYWAATSESFDRRCRGEFGDTRSTLKHLARQCGCDVDDRTLDHALTVHLQSYQDLAAPHPRAVAVLAQLRDGGCRIGVLTDCSSELPEVWTETMWPSHVDGVSFSAVTGQRKPHPAGYLDIADQLGVDPVECWFVGDGGSGEHLGAKSAGMRPVLVTNAAYGVAHLRTDPDAYGPADAIDDLSEVPQLLLGKLRPDLNPA